MAKEDDNLALAYEFFKEIYEECNVSNFQNKSMPKNMGEISVLGALDAKGSCTSGELSTALNIKTARMAAILKALEEKGHIIRKHPKDDKRVTEVSLTEAGKKICQDSIRCIILRIARAYEVIGKDEMNQFKTTLLKLCKLAQKGETSCLN